MVYQSLVILLHFCNTKVITLMPYLCTAMTNYDIILYESMQDVSSHFINFVTTWLHYRKANYNDVLWNPRMICKTPFDEVLDKLKEYLVILNNKGMIDAHTNLESAVSIVFGHPRLNYTF